ncbi:MAG TPA: DUF948 domain-containing protein [Acidimicrobiia bacterium]|nr:DUF948 domain-containing protein [Acidimicrobiia bacterium]
MSASEVAAIIAAVAAAVLVVGLLLALFSLGRTLGALREAVDELHRETIPLVRDMQQTVQQANHDLRRVEGIIETAESVGQTVDAASRLAYLTFSNPVVKAMALGAGVARAGRRLRKPNGKS